MTNATIFPFRTRDLGYDDYFTLRQMANERNAANRQTNHLNDEEYNGTN
jgi:hypothetical protein